MLVARDVEVTVADGAGGIRILGPVSLEVAPGSLVALMGPSGSGKSTLLRVLSGVAEPTTGTATWSDQPTALAVQSVGYVQQRESVHERLTTREALHYAAALRLDADAAIDRRVASVLDELGLVGQAGTMIRNLSGGERRRAACGLELVGDPHVLLLDEPTSGLDTVLERRLMELFRRLADHGRAVLVVTHATASLELCDEVVYLQKGVATHRGHPAGARAYLEAVGRDSRREPDAAAQQAAAAAAEAAPPAAPAKRPFGLELRLLASRYSRTLLRDGRTLGLLVGQAPVIGVLIAIVFHPGALAAGSSSSNAVELIFMVMTASIWLGVTSSCREVVKERGLVEREFDVGVRLDAYIFAKATVLFALVLVQVLLLVGVVITLQPLHISTGGVGQLLLLAILTGWTSAAVGLAVSCLARTVDQAAGSVPLILMPQLLFAGALVPLARMPGFVSALSNITYARWAYAGMGNAAGMNGRLAADPNSPALGFASNFFSLQAGVA
ncbi:MAG TPA: ATP-binding cassette domain-containing protein, partial [Solirubrobacteraceae bacterium]|nr:ATP-binding cassette domain-containing protein [Solirubrobacteraceae bacterium]